MAGTPPGPTCRYPAHGRGRLPGAAQLLIASPPEDEFVTLTVERVENGEVSPYLVEELRSGDQFELRGPIGGYFVWTIAIGGPLCVVAADPVLRP